MSKRNQTLNLSLTLGEKVRFEFLASQMGLSVSRMLAHLVAHKIVTANLWDRPEIQESINLDTQTSKHPHPT